MPCKEYARQQGTIGVNGIWLLPNKVKARSILHNTVWTSLNSQLCLVISVSIVYKYEFLRYIVLGRHTGVMGVVMSDGDGDGCDGNEWWWWCGDVMVVWRCDGDGMEMWWWWYEMWWWWVWWCDGDGYGDVMVMGRVWRCDGDSMEMWWWCDGDGYGDLKVTSVEMWWWWVWRCDGDGYGDVMVMGRYGDVMVIVWRCDGDVMVMGMEIWR